MKKLALIVFASAVLAVGDVTSALAQEIVVTASRYRSAFGELPIPHVSQKRRADFAISELEVRSDTRDFTERRNEMREALRGLEARARSGQVTLALTDDGAGLVRPFSMGAAEELIVADRRPDTSLVTIRLRTPVAAEDTLESLHGRIERFVAGAAKPGRVEMEAGDTELTLVNPEQYRPELLRDIANDGNEITAMLGVGYGLQLTGLERQVAWRRTGDLELTLFVSYTLSAAPISR